jgi:hypothetical protein
MLKCRETRMLNESATAGCMVDRGYLTRLSGLRESVEIGMLCGIA